MNKLLNAIREPNYDAAFEEAAAIDEQLAHTDAAKLNEVCSITKRPFFWSFFVVKLEATKPLLGVPFIVIDTLKCAGLRTCCGLAAFLEAPANIADAEVVTRFVARALDGLVAAVAAQIASRRRDCARDRQRERGGARLGVPFDGRRTLIESIRQSSHVRRRRGCGTHLGGGRDRRRWLGAQRLDAPLRASMRRFLRESALALSISALNARVFSA